MVSTYMGRFIKLLYLLVNWIFILLSMHEMDILFFDSVIQISNSLTNILM